MEIQHHAGCSSCFSELIGLPFIIDKHAFLYTKPSRSTNAMHAVRYCDKGEVENHPRTKLTVFGISCYPLKDIVTLECKYHDRWSRRNKSSSKSTFSVQVQPSYEWYLEATRDSGLTAFRRRCERRASSASGHTPTSVHTGSSAGDGTQRKER